MNAREEELYISVDIEASGPIPGEYSMLSLGACVVANASETFYAELKPVSDKFILEALAVSKLDLDQLRNHGEEPAIAMSRLASWVAEAANGMKPVFVGFNAGFDWSFVNWYFYKFLNKNPFGIGGIDIKALYMGMAGVTWEQTRSSQLPDEFQPTLKHTHNALDDAKSQAEIFLKVLAASRRHAEP